MVSADAESVDSSAAIVATCSSMPALDCLVLAPTPDPHVFLTAEGRRVSPPDGWACLPPGDAAVTRRVKEAGPSWVVQEKRGRKIFSRGLWAPRATIEAVRAQIESERATPEYAKKRQSDLARRERVEQAYARTFEEEVAAFLRFSPRWDRLSLAMAKRMAAHATPVGSGTVARTKRISVAERAEAAVIAWMRHQTTAYDSMTIARIKGERREVRRALAQVSRAVLDLHRSDASHEARRCPLCSALAAEESAHSPNNVGERDVLTIMI